MEETVNQTDVLAAAVATGKTIKRAAESIGMTERKAYEISRTMEFRLKLSDLRHSMVADTVDSMRQLFGDAVERLKKNINSPDDKTASDAIKILFTQYRWMGEYVELSQRIDIMEQRDGVRLVERLKEFFIRNGQQLPEGWEDADAA
jgi:hypothetical protein